MSRRDDSLDDDCQYVLERVWVFLDHELDEASGDVIRQHLSACEQCLESFDVELAFKSLVARRCGGETAPQQLRDKIVDRLLQAREQPPTSWGSAQA
jgi:mycothiol system anti-sigma-R factor